MFFVKNIELIKTNLVLVVSAIFIGIIISISAQYFAYSTSIIYSWIQNNEEITFFNISKINLFPLIACFIASIFVCLIIKYQNIQKCVR